jgi:hypothetical protein
MLFLRSLSIGCLIVIWASADPITLQIAPQLVTAGQTVNENVVISGLGLPPEVGAFDLGVSYDPTLLRPTGITFGDFLGDPLQFEALTASNLSFAPNIVEGAEVSLLSNAQLDALQLPSFTLFTIDFLGIGNGAAAFQYAGGPVDDGNGSLIFGTKSIVPEPNTLLLLGSVLLSLIVLTSLRKALKARRLLKSARTADSAGL